MMAAGHVAVPVGAASDRATRVLDETQFRQVCSGLNIGSAAQGKVWSVVQFLYANYPSEMEARSLKVWTLCALYISGRDQYKTPLLEGTSRQTLAGLPLSQLMNAGQMGMRERQDFLNALRTVATLIQLDGDFEQHVTQLERKFVVLDLIYGKYKELFEAVFRSDGSEEELLLYKFCWTLFLVAKMKQLGCSDDLVHSVNLLICAVNFCRRHCTPALLREDYADQSSEGDSECVRRLCDIIHTSYEDVQVKEQQEWRPFVEQSLLKREQREAPAASPTASTSDFSLTQRSTEPADDAPNDLLSTSNGHLQSNLTAINREYDLDYYRCGEIDERIYLQGDDAVPAAGMQTPETPSRPVAVARAHSRRVMRNLARTFEDVAREVPSTPLTTKRLVQAMSADAVDTPVSFAIQNARRLRDMIERAPAGPSERLAGILADCQQDPRPAVEERLQDIRAQFVTAYESCTSADPRVPERYYAAGTQLYYRFLDKLADAEKKRTGMRDLSKMMSRDEFHRSLVACCLEIIIFHNGLHSVAFPWVLRVANVPAFEFWKVIEPMIRVDPELSRAMIKRLGCMEESILEALVWKSDSEVWAAIKRNNNEVPSSEASLPPSAAASPAQGLPLPPPGLPFLAGGGFASPGHPSQLRGNGVPSSPQLLRLAQYAAGMAAGNLTLPGPGSPGVAASPARPRPASSLELFFRKVYHLAHVRVRDLCRRLGLGESLIRKVWTCFERSVSHAAVLLKDRHLDQLILCAVYAISKVSLCDLTFKAIVAKYREQPQFATHVYRSVLISPAAEGEGGGEERRDTIIAFYNDAYIVTMKSFILQFSPRQHPPLSPAPPATGQIPSPRKVPGHEFYVKPLSMPRDARSLTPRTSCLYNFGESPAELRHINERLKPRVRQRLNFDGDEQSDSSSAAQKRSKMQLLAQQVFGSQSGSTEQGDGTHESANSEHASDSGNSSNDDNGDENVEEEEDDDDDEGDEGNEDDEAEA